MATNNAVTRYAQWVITHPLIAILLTLLLVGAGASGGRFLAFTTDYRVFFSTDNPELVAFDSLEKMYTKNDNVMFIVTPQDGNVFTPQTLKAIQELTLEAWQVPHSIRVDSIANFQHTEADGDELIVRDLVPEDEDLDAAALEKIKTIALSEPLLLRRLISETGHVAGVNVTVQLPGKNPGQEVPEIVAFARDLAKQFMEKYPSIEIRLSGMVMMNNAFSEASKQDMSSLVPISFVLMLITLGLLLKGFSGTVGTMLIIIFSILVAMGVGGYLGFPITPPSASTPTIVLTMAIANAVHVLVTFLHEMRQGLEKKAAMIESLRINMQPVFLASVTTALGFLSMNFADVPPFIHLGNMVAIGVLASFVFTVFFLPAFMMLLPVRVRVRQAGDGYLMMDHVGEFVVNNRKRLMWGMMVVIVTLIAFIPRNELNDVFVHYFDHSIKFRTDADYFTENLSGLYIIDYSLDSGEAGGISNPQFMADVARFADWYRQQPEVLHVNTFTDIMKRLNKNMHGDDETYYREPRERDLAAQYLLLYEMSLPYGLDLNNQINIDKSATRFTVTLQTMSTNNLLALEKRAEDWLAENTTTIKEAHGSGTTMMFAHIGKKNIKSMLLGTTVALVMISLLLIFALRSVKIGLISMIPNLVPAAMGFGLWGIFVGEVGLALSVVMGMTLGIVVDDTVHFLSKYLRARREKHLSAPQATVYAFHTVGMALLTTSIVLVVGFLILALSAFKLNAGMGTLTAIVIALALLADFFFLPTLLMKLEEKKDEHTDTARSATDTTAV
ncbi:MAG: RND transporter [Gammaproteobacteria bacterium SG8_15]|nr:MAG: RND transporter [Gammaproteobacteria bacterium SG8_15]